MARRLRWLAPFLALASLACTNGPVEDYSRLESATALPDVRVAVSYHRLRYRPATGVAAFPDGGIPKYVRDQHAILIVDPDGTTREIAAFPGGGLPGTGSLTFLPPGEDGGNLLLWRYAQRTTSLPLDYLREVIRMRPDGTVLDRLNLGKELAAMGREPGAQGFGTLEIVRPDGTMLIGAEQGDQRELWLRPPGGKLQLIDRFNDYRQRRGTRLLYVRDGQVVLRDLAGGEPLVTDWRDPRIRAFEAEPAPATALSATVDGQTVVLRSSNGSQRRITPNRTVLDGD